jgi:hypothetical protein
MAAGIVLEPRFERWKVCVNLVSHLPQGQNRFRLRNVFGKAAGPLG